MEPPTSSSKERPKNFETIDLVEKIPYQDISAINTSTSSISLLTSSDGSSSAVMVSSPSASSLQHISPSVSAEADSSNTLIVKVHSSGTIQDARDTTAPTGMMPYAEFKMDRQSGNISELSGNIDVQRHARFLFDGHYDDDEKPIPTAAQLQEEMDRGTADVLTFGSDVRGTMFVEDTRVNRSDNTISTLNSVESFTTDPRPYPPMPGGYHTVSSSNTSNTLSGFNAGSLQESAESAESVLKVPSHVEAEGNQHQQAESNVREIMRDLHSNLTEEEQTQLQYNQQVHQLFPSGLQVSYLGNQHIATSEAMQNIMRPFIRGQQAFGPQQAQAQAQAQMQAQVDAQAQEAAILHARHQARVANTAFENHSRVSGLRSRLEKKDNGGAKIEELTEQELNGKSVPGLAKGLTKRPPKPRTKGAKILALRNTKLSRSNTPGMFSYWLTRDIPSTLSDSLRLCSSNSNSRFVHEARSPRSKF